MAARFIVALTLKTCAMKMEKRVRARAREWDKKGSREANAKLQQFREKSNALACGSCY